MLRRVFTAALAVLTFLAGAPEALAAVVQVGNVRQVDDHWPTWSPNSGCWTVQVRQQKAWAPDTSPEALRVIRRGYDGNAQPTLYAEDLVITKAVRQQFNSTYPASGYLFRADRAALSNFVYATDNIPGVKNLCTSIAPQPVGGWATPSRLTFGNTLGTVEVLAFSRDARNNREAAAVTCTADDHNGHTVSGTVGAMTVSGRAGDKWAVVQFTCPALDLSTLTNQHYFTLDACIYPWIGGAGSVNCSNKNTDTSLASNDGTFSTASDGFTTRYFWKDTGNPLVAYLCLTSDGTCSGAGSTSCTASTTAATALAASCSTFQAAMNAFKTAGAIDNAILYIGANTGTPPTLNGPSAGAMTQNGGCLTVTRNPTTTRANAQLNFGVANTLAVTTLSNVVTGCMRFNDLKLIRSTNSVFKNQSTCASGGRLKVQFDAIDLDGGGFASNWFLCADDEWYGIMNIANFPTGNLGAAAAGHHRIFRGVSLSTMPIEWKTIIGSAFTGDIQLAAPNLQTHDGNIFAFNSAMAKTNNTNFLSVDTNTVNGIAIVQNVWENTGTVSENMMGVSHDLLTNSNTNTVWQYNSYAGADTAGRVNIFYDERGSPRYTRMQDCRGNSLVQLNVKSDLFDGTSGGDAAGAPTRTGNWPMVHGVGCGYQYEAFTTPTPRNESPMYYGLNSVQGTSEVWASRNDPLYTVNGGTDNNGGSFHAGAGSTDFTPQAGSPLIGRVLVPMLPYDLNGNARLSTLDTTGAVCRASGGVCQ